MRWILPMVAVLAGCAVPLSMFYFKGSPKAPLVDDVSAKKFLPNKNNGTIYIFRDRLIGNDDAIQVRINDMIIGNLEVFSYFSFVVQPGNYDLRTAIHPEITTVNTTRGGMTFISVEMGIKENQLSQMESVFVIKPVPKERGMMGVLNSDRLRHQYHILPMLAPVSTIR